MLRTLWLALKSVWLKQNGRVELKVGMCVYPLYNQVI